MNLPAMRAAAAEVDDLLGSALSIIEEDPACPERDRAHDLVRSYIQLAGASLERLEEAARGN